MMRFLKPTIYIFFFLLFFSMAESVDAAGGSGTCTSPPSVYYSVGQDAADHKTGSPTVTISSGTATFSVAQTATNMGVGDRVTYGQIDITSFADQGGGLVRITTSTAHAFLNDDYISISGTTNYNGTYKIANATANSYFDITHGYTAETGGSTKYAANIAYISGKTSTTAWTLIDKLGCSYISNRASAVVVNSIAHEYTSLAAAEAGASDSNHLNTTNLVTPGRILNIPLYYDSGPDTTAVTIGGWTTGASNYIKVYTPNNTTTEVNQSQRHSGKWNANIYRLEVNTTNQTTVNALGIGAAYTRIVGLQIKRSDTNNSNTNIACVGAGATVGIRISDSILSKGSNAYSAGIQNAYGNTIKAYNNLFIGFNQSVYLSNTGRTAEFYNNTFVNCQTTTIGTGSIKLVNNLFYGSAPTGTYAAPTDYNASSGAMGYTVTGGGNTHDRASQTFTFVGAGNGDYHLASTDAGAKDYGVSSPGSGLFSDDIDGQTRTGSWDIGADEYVVAVAIYRSVSPGVSSVLANGATNALNISGSTATFATALPDNIGVGDVLEYDDDNNGTIDASDSIAFITGRTSSTIYTIKKADGTAPTIPSAADEIHWNINRAYTSLFNAEAGTESTVIDADLRNFDTWSGGKDIVASNEQWNIAAYANGTTPDSTAVVVDGWTTGAQNYIKIYTPVSGAEVGASQRHAGKWDNNKYNLSVANNVLVVQDPYIKIFGLQININTDVEWRTGVTIGSGANNTEVGYLLVKSINTGVNQPGIRNSVGSNLWVKIYNNIIYALNGGIGVVTMDQDASVYVYNNNVINCGIGITTGYLDVIAKNNIVQNCTDGFYGSFDSSSDYNISDLATDAPSPSYRNNFATTVSFADAANDDFHLAPADRSARDTGTDLSTDANLPFATDIDGESRPLGQGWDIGADEAAYVPEYRMDGNIKLKGHFNFQ